jgi:hypothetical protein
MRMSNKPAKFAGAIFVALIAGLGLITVPHAASAADECLTDPNGPTPAGKHWRYHIERGTGRHCWYLRGADDAATATAATDQSAAANDDEGSSTKDQAPVSRRAAKTADAPATRSISDARAELPARPQADDSRSAAPAARPAPQIAANASVFPDPQAVLGTKPAASAAPSADAASPDTDTQPDTTASITPTPAPSPVLGTQAPSLGAGPLGDRHLGSLPMLLLVAFGALGLAGLTGSTVYRLASASRRVRREDRWQRNVDTQPAPRRRRAGPTRAGTRRPTSVPPRPCPPAPW